MVDKKKVLTGLECLITDKVPCEECPYDRNCVKSIAIDAKELLKGQGPKPVLSDRQCENGRTGFCPKCHQVVKWYLNRSYCGFCGQELKWE